MKILDYLKEDMIISGLEAGRKDDAIDKIVGAMIDAGMEGERKIIVKELLEREATGSTGIGNGVAIPHAKTDHVKQLCLAYARSKAGVDFEAVDGKPVNHFFLVVSPSRESSTQLMLLARISRLMGNRLLRNELEAAQTPGEVIDTIKKYDGQ